MPTRMMEIYVLTFEYANVPLVLGAEAEPDLSGNLQKLFGETTSPVVHGHSQISNLTEKLPHANLIHMQENCPDFHEMPDNEKEAKATLWESEQYILADQVLYHLYQPRTKNLSAPERTIKTATTRCTTQLS